ncbi:hypothetical protein [Microscilla marina]|uniref:Uncharacterized protein n=1 Tax=Microscilla marina ATCC 23134 TaxID=313606 RepID=A1ZMW1_MICM2|nr:hypothetical protein [Microscilla marina]EAY28142.1 hypothetical protein M23134_03403 [Microscilla marina ATCC 23134]
MADQKFKLHFDDNTTQEFDAEEKIILQKKRTEKEEITVDEVQVNQKLVFYTIESSLQDEILQEVQDAPIEVEVGKYDWLDIFKKLKSFYVTDLAVYRMSKITANQNSFLKWISGETDKLPLKKKDFGIVLLMAREKGIITDDVEENQVTSSETIADDLHSELNMLELTRKKGAICSTISTSLFKKIKEQRSSKVVASIEMA